MWRHKLTQTITLFLPHYVLLYVLFYVTLRYVMLLSDAIVHLLTKTALSTRGIPKHPTRSRSRHNDMHCKINVE